MFDWAVWGNPIFSTITLFGWVFVIWAVWKLVFENWFNDYVGEISPKTPPKKNVVATLFIIAFMVWWSIVGASYGIRPTNDADFGRTPTPYVITPTVSVTPTLTLTEKGATAQAENEKSNQETKDKFNDLPTVERD